MLVQLLVHRDGCEDNRRLAGLGPGSLIEVSEVMGRGCASSGLNNCRCLAVLLVHIA